MIYEHYTEKWQQPQYYPQVFPTGQLPQITIQPSISPEEIAEFRKLLERAREYDKRNNEPDCELETKRETLKKLAEQLGVAISFP